MRTPSSDVRCETPYEMTPYTPTAASTRATPANTASSSVLNRSRATDDERMRSSVMTLDTGTVGSWDLNSARAELLRRLERPDEARESFQRAIDLADNAAERRFLQRRLDECAATQR